MKIKKTKIKRAATADEIKKACGITEEDMKVVEKILSELKMFSRIKRKKINKNKAK